MKAWAIIRLVLDIVIGLSIGGFLIAHFLKKSDDPGRLIYKWVISGLILAFVFLSLGPMTQSAGGVFVVPFIAACGIILGILWAPHIGASMAGIFTSLYDGGEQTIEHRPLYSVAEARRKQGRFQEALIELGHELEKFPEDFSGQFLRAEIQAENLNDLPAAEVTVEKILQQPGHHPRNISLVLNCLADWQLKFEQDPEKARATLKRIPELFPESEYSYKALQRIAHLATPGRALPIPDRPRMVLKTRPRGEIAQPASEPDSQDNIDSWLAQLQENPVNDELREKLALEYAGKDGAIPLAREQLELLINQPHSTHKQVSRWLHLLTDIYIRSGEVEAARSTLQRILERFPGTALEQTARKRLMTLALEFKGKEKSQAIKLGSYEQRMGLKKF